MRKHISLFDEQTFPFCYLVELLAQIPYFSNMEIDAGKLIALIESRPALYNFTLKEHHNKELMEKMWKDISKELGARVIECKAKWNSIRSSYCRYLREQKKVINGTGSHKKKKWYLAENMSFLEHYVGHRKSLNNSLEEQEMPYEIKPDDTEENQSNASNDSFYNPSTNVFKSEKSKIPKITSVETSFADPMVEYYTNKSNAEKYETPKNATMLFFESLGPDVNKLTPKNQRNFKQGVLSLLNHLLDAQEADAERNANFAIKSNTSSPGYNEMPSFTQSMTAQQPSTSQL